MNKQFWRKYYGTWCLKFEILTCRNSLHDLVIQHKKPHNFGYLKNCWGTFRLLTSPYFASHLATSIPCNCQSWIASSGTLKLAFVGIRESVAGTNWSILPCTNTNIYVIIFVGISNVWNGSRIVKHVIRKGHGRALIARSNRCYSKLWMLLCGTLKETWISIGVMIRTAYRIIFHGADTWALFGWSGGIVQANLGVGQYHIFTTPFAQNRKAWIYTVSTVVFAFVVVRL